MYGSLVNRLMERSGVAKLEVGMGVTECLWSDRHAWEIISIKDDRHITIRRMDAECLDYFAGDYELSSNPNNRTINLFKTAKGVWRERIGKNGLGDTIFSVGHASEYIDPSF